MAFLDDNYLITSAAGKRIYDAIRDLPVVDMHNHANVAEIAANQPYRNLWQLLGATDHYVWEIMRKCGVPEERITGSASDQEKFFALAEAMPLMVGNPVYEWTHLDLRRCLGIEEELNAATAAAVWRKGLEALADPANLPQELLKKLRIESFCSTDDPADTLEHHDAVNQAFGRIIVRPTWRPDAAMNIDAPGWLPYIQRLGARYNKRICTYADLIETLRISHGYFHEHGCRASDHGVEYPPCRAALNKAEQLFRRACDGEQLSRQEADAFRGRFLYETAKMDADRNWVFQLHAGPVRNVRRNLMDALGPDSGGDICSLHQNFLPGMLELLNRFDDRLKVVLYTLDPAQQPTLATVSRAFGNRVRLGAAWWFNDTPYGIRTQLDYIASVDLLSAFTGMVSDSRKITSYGSRFEVFRRVLADVLGVMADRGQAPEELLIRTAINICYDGPKQFFDL